MKKLLILVISWSVATVAAQAQTIEPPYPEGPGLEFVCELRVNCGPAYTVGQTAHGTRMVIPILGGTFSGPAMKGAANEEEEFFHRGRFSGTKIAFPPL